MDIRLLLLTAYSLVKKKKPRKNLFSILTYTVKAWDKNKLLRSLTCWIRWYRYAYCRAIFLYNFSASPETYNSRRICYARLSWGQRSSWVPCFVISQAQLCRSHDLVFSPLFSPCTCKLVECLQLGHSLRGTQRRFPPKYIENTFQAIQSKLLDL